MQTIAALAGGILACGLVRWRSSCRKDGPIARIVRFRDSSGRIVIGEDVGTDVCEELRGDVLQPASLQRTGRFVRIGQRLAPVDPAAILCIGLNYRAHASESEMALPKYPVLFIKNPAAAVGHNSMIQRPAGSTKVDYEAELAVVIGRACRNVSEENALDYVAGYCCANDVSEREWQLEPARSGTQFCRGKSFDTFCPLGPALVTSLDTSDLEIATYLNGDQVQGSRTSSMIFSIPQLISFLSTDMTLLPGTVILTGTPEGVGFARTPPLFLQPGDVVKVSIEGVGELINTMG